MPYSATHILVPIIFLELLRDDWPKASRFFSRKYTFLIGVAGALPDIDLHIYPIVEFLGKSFPITYLGHRIIFHNLWIPFGFLLFFFLFYYVIPHLNLRLKNLKRRKKLMVRFKKFGKVFLILFIGWTIHLILDAVLTGQVMPFYPLNTYIVDYDLIGRIENATGVTKQTILVSMDALLLFFWLWHEETHRYIKDYF